VAKLWIILTVLLTGCIHPSAYDPSYTNPLPTKYPEVFLIGDSICDDLYNFGYTYAEIVGVNYNCKGQRRLTRWLPQKFYGPNEYEKIVIALGINDAGKDVSIHTYESQLIEYLSYDDSSYYCILPYGRRAEMNLDPYRQVMLDLCPNTFDPGTVGLVLEDAVHYTENDHKLIAPYIENWLL
jgi:hypothetical protein